MGKRELSLKVRFSRKSNFSHLKADSENYTDAEMILDKFNVKCDDDEMFDFLENSNENSLMSTSK